MDQNTSEMPSHPAPGVISDFQAAIKQEKELFIGDTELQQMRGWCLSGETDLAIHHDLKPENQCEDRRTSSEKCSYYIILHDVRKTECLECGKLLSGTRTANIRRHYKLVHKRDIKIGRERRSSDEDYADQSSLNDTQKESIQDSVNSYDSQMEIKLGNELIVPDTEQNLRLEHLQDFYEKPEIKSHSQTDDKEIKSHSQTDDKTSTRDRYSCYMNYFTILKDINKTECLECGKLLCGIGKSNIQRHYRLVHKKIIDNGREESSSSDEDDTEPPTKKTKSINSFSTNIDESRFLKCCIGLVAVGNIPIRIFDDRDFFKTLISPYERKFGTDLNSTNIVPVLDVAVAKIHKRITKRVKNKMVSLNIDIATKMNKGTVGINIQYLKDFKVCYNTLGVLQLDKVQKGTNLKDEILKCLDSYGIATCQIYSITTDNGANVVKANKILQDFHDENILQDLGQVERHTEDYSSDALDNIDGRTIEGSIHNSLASVMQANISVANTIQLAAYDVLMLLQIELVQCRDIVKKIRTSLRSSGLKLEIPVLDNATSWYSTYRMLKSLHNIKEYVCTMYITNWDFVTDFLSAFEPLAKCTEQLQNDQYIAGDFYRDWFSCELELVDLFSTTSYAKLLHEAMQDKKKLLFQNIAFTSALFLDPRFNFINSMMLSEEHKNKAVAHLVKTFEMIQNLENSQPQCEQSECMTEHPNGNDDSYTEETNPSEGAYAKMAKHIASLVAMTTKSSETQRSIKQKLILLSNCKMVPIHTDILQYFKYTMMDPDISKIMDVVLSVPANQITVERTYSGLAVTLTKPHTKLTNTSLYNLLLTKLNVRELNSKHVQLEYSDYLC